MKRFLGCLLAALLALSLCACAESAQAGKATVTVDQSALYARVGEEVTLPAATAADAEGKDCSASVSVTVTFGGNTVFTGKGNAENTFTPTQEGAYTANYFVAEGESVLSGVRFIDRGYESMEKLFSSLGAKITRERVPE